MVRLEKGPESAFLAQSKIRFPSIPGIVAGKPMPIFMNYHQIAFLHTLQSRKPYYSITLYFVKYAGQCHSLCGDGDSDHGVCRKMNGRHKSTTGYRYEIYASN